MQELIKAATRAFNAIAAHYEGQGTLSFTKPAAAHYEGQGVLPIASVHGNMKCSEPVAMNVPAPAKTRRTKAPKAEPAAPAPAPASEVDVLMGGAPAPAPAAVAAAPAMTETESAGRVCEINKTLVKRFGKAVKDLSYERPMPEGFFLARNILNEKFKGAKTTDLNHAQRLEYIAAVEAIIGAADAAGAAA